MTNQLTTSWKLSRSFTEFAVWYPKLPFGRAKNLMKLLVFWRNTVKILLKFSKEIWKIVMKLRVNFEKIVKICRKCFEKIFCKRRNFLGNIGIILKKLEKLKWNFGKIWRFSTKIVKRRKIWMISGKTLQKNEENLEKLM